ncbi:MAG: lysophospholipid acyltransferase family protein [Endomicrobiia bacterium]
MGIKKFFSYLRNNFIIKFIEEKILPHIAWFIIQIISRLVIIERINYNKIKTLKNKIYAFFHGEQFLLVFAHKYHNIVIMTSLSRDGELQTKILSKFGYEIVRGSYGKKGASSGTLAIIEKIKNGKSCAITVDGPHGPAFKVKPGVIFLAQKTSCPVVPVRVFVTPKIQLKNWDRYIIPLPFISKSYIVYGDPIYINFEDDIREKSKELEIILKTLDFKVNFR